MSIYQPIEQAMTYIRNVLSIDMSNVHFTVTNNNHSIQIHTNATPGSAVLIRYRGKGQEAWIQKIWNISSQQSFYLITPVMLFDFHTIELTIVGYQHKCFVKTEIVL